MANDDSSRERYLQNVLTTAWTVASAAERAGLKVRVRRNGKMAFKVLISRKGIRRKVGHIIIRNVIRSGNKIPKMECVADDAAFMRDYRWKLRYYLRWRMVLFELPGVEFEENPKTDVELHEQRTI
jgi:hypothetical protein